MHIWSFSQQVKPDSSMKVKWCFLISPKSAGASNYKPLPLPRKPLLLSASKRDAQWTPPPSKGQAEHSNTGCHYTAAGWSSCSVWNSCPQTPKTAAAGWSWKCGSMTFALQALLFSARDNISEGGSSQAVPWGVWTVSKPVF